MKPRNANQDAVTLLLHTASGDPWPLSLSRDCLMFVGRYRRIDEFGIDERILFQAARRAG